MKYQNRHTISRDILLKHLTEGICQISFTKVKDNSNRVIYCTLHKSFIPTKFAPAIDKIFTEKNPDLDIMPIWDIAEGKWKSFRISNSVYFITSDEIMKEPRTAHNTVSKLAEETESKKKEIMDEFRKRVEELKRKAQEARNNINGVNNEDQA